MVLFEISKDAAKKSIETPLTPFLKKCVEASFIILFFTFILHLRLCPKLFVSKLYKFTENFQFLQSFFRIRLIFSILFANLLCILSVKFHKTPSFSVVSFSFQGNTFYLKLFFSKTKTFNYVR